MAVLPICVWQPVFHDEGMSLRCHYQDMCAKLLALVADWTQYDSVCLGKVDA